jgi:DNA-binding transcriptional LysR family regulator
MSNTSSVGLIYLLGILDFQVLFEEKFLVVLPRLHPLRRYSNGLHDAILDLYGKQGLSPHLTVTHTETHEEAGKVMVATGKGIFIGVGAMVNTSVLGVHLAAVPLNESGAKLPVCIAWRKRETSSAVLEFVASARKLFHARSHLRKGSLLDVP